MAIAAIGHTQTRPKPAPTHTTPGAAMAMQMDLNETWVKFRGAWVEEPMRVGIDHSLRQNKAAH